uniref:Uncharacterized protein n=1 Tax=Arundo donax TaxID=35708 RepID=A0A0A9GSG0_ARUDO
MPPRTCREWLDRNTSVLDRCYTYACGHNKFAKISTSVWRCNEYKRVCALQGWEKPSRIQ